MKRLLWLRAPILGRARFLRVHELSSWGIWEDGYCTMTAQGSRLSCRRSNAAKRGAAHAGAFTWASRRTATPARCAGCRARRHDLRVPDALGTYLGREMPDGSEWDGLDTYFLLHGMSGADARAHTRNCTISELCAPRASAAPLFLPHSGGQLKLAWKPSYTAAPSEKSASSHQLLRLSTFPR